MTNKELGQQIRKALKEKGFNSKSVGVSVRSPMYDTVVNITIKDPTVNKLEIESILKKFEEFERDARTGEILQGGNTFLFIDTKYGLYDEVAKEFEEVAKKALSSKEETTKIFDGLLLINWEHSGDLELRQRNDIDFCTFKVYNFNHLCEFIYKFVYFGTIAA